MNKSKKLILIVFALFLLMNMAIRTCAQIRLEIGERVFIDYTDRDSIELFRLYERLDSTEVRVTEFLGKQNEVKITVTHWVYNYVPSDFDELDEKSTKYFKFRTWKEPIFEQLHRYEITRNFVYSKINKL